MLPPKSNWLPHSDHLPRYDVCIPSTPSPKVPPLPPSFYQPRPPWGPPRYPFFMCYHKIGKDSLKCSTCSKWVHFSCSSLTQANFCKIYVAGSTMGWNCPACLNGDLASPTHQQVSTCPFSPALPPTNKFRSNGFIFISPLTPSFRRHSTFHTTTTHKHTTNPQLAATPSTNSTPPSKPQNSAMECWRSFSLTSC